MVRCSGKHLERELYEELGLYRGITLAQASPAGMGSDHGIGRRCHHGDGACSQSNSAVERYRFSLSMTLSISWCRAGMQGTSGSSIFLQARDSALEIALGYQHRGVESFVQRPAHAVRIAESVSGDSVIALPAAANAMEVLETAFLHCPDYSLIALNGGRRYRDLGALAEMCLCWMLHGATAPL